MEYNMKNTLKNTALIMALMVLAAVSAMAQVQPNLTTLSAAMTASTQTAVVGSATGFVANDILIVDHEAMLVPSNYTAATATITNLTRGYNGTLAMSHKSGATVMRITAANLITNSRMGSCTRANQNILPLPSINRTQRDVTMFDCLGGQWYEVTLPDDQPTQPIAPFCSIPIGDTAYASIGTNTTDIADKRMTTSLFVPYTKVFTGIQFLQGGTATTDNITTQIADSEGKIIATGAAAGTLLATADTFKSVAFALNRAGTAQTTTIISGPALYMVSIVGNGTAAGAYRTVKTATFKNLVSQGTTSITFGTFPDFTPPTTFTADLAPVVCLYN